MTSRAMRNLSLFVLCASVSILAGCAVTVPGVVGLTQTAAQTLITDAGLTVGTVTEDHSETVATGLVISQNPAFGASAPKGAAVDLVVSLGSGKMTVTLPGNVPLEFVWIPAGSFVMGSPDTEANRQINEGPQHTVVLNGFWMAKYELTQRQWTAVMVTTPWAGQANVLVNAEAPAVYVSWKDARDFISALNVLTAKAFRLPSEAEWEYACRAGTTTRAYWGDDTSGAVVTQYVWQGGIPFHAHEVGQKLPNAFGLFDMIGNVSEWCEDDWHDDYTGAPTNGSAWIDSPRGVERSNRGSNFSSDIIFCRSALRAGDAPSGAGFVGGFRIAGS